MVSIDEKYRQQIEQEHQAQRDLIELGIIHAASALAKETVEAAENDDLTLLAVRALSRRLTLMLAAFDKKADEVESYKRYHEKCLQEELEAHAEVQDA